MTLTVQNGNLSDFKRAGAGFAAGITEALIVVTPFEVVKIKLQQQKGTSREMLRYKVCCCGLLLLARCSSIPAARVMARSCYKKRYAAACRCQLGCVSSLIILKLQQQKGSSKKSSWSQLLQLGLLG